MTELKICLQKSIWIVIIIIIWLLIWGYFMNSGYRKWYLRYHKIDTPLSIVQKAATEFAHNINYEFLLIFILLRIFIKKHSHVFSKHNYLNSGNIDRTDRHPLYYFPLDNFNLKFNRSLGFSLFINFSTVFSFLNYVTRLYKAVFQVLYIVQIYILLQALADILQ